MKKLLEKIIGSYSDRAIKKIMPIVKEINGFEESIKSLDDEKLSAKTDEFRTRLKNGETLDDILPEAFAVVREASRRVLGMRHFDVQLIGGIVLHQGRPAVRRRIAFWGCGPSRYRLSAVLCCIRAELPR